MLVPAEDAEALAVELARLLADDRLRATLARRGRARVEAGFSPEAVGHGLRDFLLRRGMRLSPLYSAAPV